MKKSTLLTMSLAVAATVSFQDVMAQHSGVAPRFGEVAGNAVDPTNYHKDYVKRFFINEPASVAGSKVYTITNSGLGRTGDWGGSINSVWNNVEIVAAKDSLGCASLTNAAAISGKWALIYRGDCEFGRKALMAQQANAEGVIIVNNVPGGPVGMGAGAQGNQVTIPVLMISKDDGDAINAELNAGNTVKLSIAPWGVGVANDLGFLPTGGALWGYYAIPQKQLATGNGNPAPYKAVTGAFFGNFGTSAQTNIVVKNTLSFIPDGGSATVLREDSIEISNFPTSDSIMYAFNDALTDVHATGKGRIEASYTLTSNQTDDLPGDNVWSTSSYVTDTIFSKARYDFSLGRPMVTSSYGLTSGEPFLWGPMFYFAKGNDALRWVQFSVSNGDANNPSLANSPDLMVYIYEWTDQSDTLGRIVGQYLNPVGVGVKRFEQTDSSGQVFRAYITDLEVPDKAFVTRDDKWYWVVVDVPGGWYLGVDGYLNYYPRHYFLRNNTVSPTLEYYGPVFPGTTSTLASDVVTGLPFEPYYNGDSARYAQQRNGLVPSVALHLTSDTSFVSVQSVENAVAEFSMFPNPANEVLNVQIGLNKTASKVSMTILDAMGRNVMRKELSNVSNEKVSFNTNGLASGSYYLVIHTGEGKPAVRKFVVER